jgi:hypothetical protein
MTKSLENAIERLQQLPDDRQELLARLVLHELEEDERWLKSTAANVDKLQKLASDVIEADLRGECEPLDPDTL